MGLKPNISKTHLKKKEKKVFHLMGVFLNSDHFSQINQSDGQKHYMGPEKN